MPDKLSLQEKIQNMLDEIPEYAGSEHRREHTISKHDARWIANLMLVIAQDGGCNRGFSEREVLEIKGVLKERKRVLALIGTAFVGLMAYIGQKVLNALDSTFWKGVLARITH